MQRHDRHLAGAALIDGPTQRPARRLGSIDADDDAARDRGVSTGPDDRDGARGVVQYLAAHRAEQQSLEAADAPGTDDEHGRPNGRLKERSRREIAHHLPGDIRFGAHRATYQLGECRSRICLVVIRVEWLVRFGVVLGDVAPGHHSRDGLVAEGALLNGPAQCLRGIR